MATVPDKADPGRPVDNKLTPVNRTIAAGGTAIGSLTPNYIGEYVFHTDDNAVYRAFGTNAGEFAEVALSQL